MLKSRLQGARAWPQGFPARETTSFWTARALRPSLIIDVPVEPDLRRINTGVDTAGAARRLDRPGIYWSVREKSPFWMLIEAMSFLLVSSRTKSNTGFPLEGYSYDLGPAASTSSTAS